MDYLNKDLDKLNAGSTDEQLAAYIDAVYGPGRGWPKAAEQYVLEQLRWIVSENVRSGDQVLLLGRPEPAHDDTGWAADFEHADYETLEIGAVYTVDEPIDPLYSPGDGLLIRISEPDSGEGVSHLVLPFFLLQKI